MENPGQTPTDERAEFLDDDAVRALAEAVAERTGILGFRTPRGQSKYGPKVYETWRFLSRGKGKPYRRPIPKHLEKLKEVAR